MTGLGERVHLSHPDIDLSTHIQDIVNVLEYEDLRDAMLVGFSYGGMVVTVLFTQNPFPFAPSLGRVAARGQAEGWSYRELAVDHIVPETNPEALANLLLEFQYAIMRG